MNTLLDVGRIPGPIVILAPHPDDDILGAGGLIQVARRLGKSVYVVFVTNGDANGQSVRNCLCKRLTPRAYTELGRIRHTEAVKAARLLGLSAHRLFFLGLPDGILYQIATDRHFSRIHRSPYTNLTRAVYPFSYKINVPYSRGSALTLIKSVLDKTRPGTVFVNADMDIHSDHLAARFLSLQAIQELGLNASVYSYLIHYLHWPRTKGLLRPPVGVNVSGLSSLSLTGEEQTKKRRAYRMHRTQALLKDNCYSLIRKNELFWKT